MTSLHIPFLSQEVASVTDPLTLSETKLYLRIDDNNEDNLIARLIKVATKAAENYTRRSFVTQSWKLSYDDYVPSKIILPKGPIQSITSVKIIARDSTETVISANNYYLSAGSEKLIFDAAPVGHRIEIIYVAGFGNITAVPNDIKQGMLAHIAGLYESRKGNAPLESASRALYDTHRVVKL